MRTYVLTLRGMSTQMFMSLLLLIALGCASNTYVPTEAQLTCFAQADSVATERVNAECGGHLTGCSASDVIERDR